MPRRRPKKGVGPFTNITRQGRAWAVNIIRKGQPFGGWFADSVWGGRQPAAIAARHFRDGLLQRIDPDTRVRRRPPRGRRRTTSVGVSRERYVVDGRVYVRYRAEWRDAEGVTRKQGFAVRRYGGEEAKRRANQARQAGVAKAHALLLARQRAEAVRRLREAPPAPRQVRDPRSRKGISMARRRPRIKKAQKGPC